MKRRWWKAVREGGFWFWVTWLPGNRRGIRTRGGVGQGAKYFGTCRRIPSFAEYGGEGGIMMGRLITESQDGFCEAKQKKVTVTLIKEAIVGGDSLVPFDYVDKPPKCLEREQNGCNFLGKPNCLLRRLLNK